MNTKPKCFLYARKSTESEERQVQSIEDQRNYWTRRAEEMDLTIAQIFTEEKSAKAPHQRPVFREMLERIEKENIRTILCWKIDRLTRNPVDTGTIQYMLQTGVIERVITSDREYRVEDAGLLFSVESGMANQFILDLSQNTKRGMKGKIDRGWPIWPAPIGYLNDRLEKTVIPDPQQFNTVRRMWDTLLTGAYTPHQIYTIATEQWGLRTRGTRKIPSRKPARASIYNMFHNIFYTGDISYNGERFKGNHIPMITQEEFDRAQEMLGKKEKHRTQKNTFAYTGIIRCGSCRCIISADKKTKTLKRTKEIVSYTYYCCTHRKDTPEYRCPERKNILDHDLEQQIDTILASIEIRGEFRDWAIGILKRQHITETEAHRAMAGNLDRVIASERIKMERLTDLLLDNHIDDTEYTRRKDSLQESITKLEKERLNLSKRRGDWIDLAEKTFNFATKARASFQKGDSNAKRQILMALGSGFKLQWGKIELDIHPWFQAVRTCAENLTQNLITSEPTKKGIVMGKNDAFEDESPVWLPRMREYRTYLWGFYEALLMQKPLYEKIFTALQARNR